MAQNGQLDEPRIELAPLTFPLDRLESLSSLQLALVQFHLRNDEPGFERLVSLARSIWRERREAAIARGELLEGEARSSTPTNRPLPAPMISPKYAPFVPLVDVLREAHASTPKPLRAKVGVDLKKRDRTVYEGEYATFKSYAAAAEELGIVILGKPAGSGGGRDWILLNDKVSFASRVSSQPVLMLSTCRSTCTPRCPWLLLIQRRPPRSFPLCLLRHRTSTSRPSRFRSRSPTSRN